MPSFQTNANADWQDAGRSPRVTGEEIMPQGARVWWVRTGLGAVLCLGTVGCMGTGKSPPPRIGSSGATNKPTTLPPPGLPGIQPISATTPAPGGPNPRPAAPNTFTGGVGATGAVQPAGGFAAHPAGVQPVARAGGPPVAPVGVPSTAPALLPPSAPVGTGQLPPPSLDPPTAQRSMGASPPPPTLDPIAPPPPPSSVVSGSNYSPIAPISPPQPFPAPVPVNVTTSQGAQYGTP